MMSESQVGISNVKCIGEASCLGGRNPEPPLDKFPLLAWGHGHSVHGSKVFTEDGATSVEDIAIAACETPDYEVLAANHRTTVEHVRQALDYAFAAGFLGS
jgi:hypothetical protein